MPVYMFTYHAYASWMPDRRQGYVHHTRGLQSADSAMAAAYRRKQTQSAITFDERISISTIIIDAVREAAAHLDATIHAIIVEPTHVHLLISWSHVRDWRSMRRSVKTAISRGLNAEVRRRTWLSKNASRKRIRDAAHFDYHLLEYLPKHRGTHWYRRRDVKAARRRRQLR